VFMLVKRYMCAIIGSGVPLKDTLFNQAELG